jgi:hypothetical protein
MQDALNQVFIGLPDILEVRRFQDQKDGECFATLQDIFTTYEMCDRFAITLLHTHFPVFEHEILVEKPDLINRTIVTEAAFLEDTPSLPCGWRLMKKNSSEHQFLPNQYTDFSVVLF